MDVGFELRQAREQRGLSLQQLSRTTKISPRVLQAIEASDEGRLPAVVFTRSFVRTYASEVSLDPDETARRYFEQFAPAEAPAVTQSATLSTPAAPAPDSAGWPLMETLSRYSGAAAILLTVGILTLLLAKNYTGAKPAATPGPAVVGTAGVVAAPAPPPAPASVTTPAPPSALHLTIAPTGDCWVQATVGADAVLAKLLAAGDRKDVDAPSEVTLRVGDPAAFAFSINGAPARVPGTPGRPVTVRITRENYRQFLTH